MGWSELILIGIVALIVVGPKDLPVMFRAMGKMMAKVRRMAGEFQSAMSEAAEQSGANDISRDLRGMTSAKSMGLDALNDAADRFDKWEPGKPKPTQDKPAVKTETEKLAEKRATAAQKAKEVAATKASAKADADKPADAGGSSETK
ncbi:Sec-independent protein translocase protein TatB [Parasulfitobacter algicola]|uniref:Twin-arginine translocase subunit TatB n=1 Tax=Parasulfitobacter algicola TaxID=2614809 RepID=A0ABX2IVI9_9RHOB|nr:Sec-independent protein translocase protein TatB [Sulfitobacter algicola]NSX54384.1 twin-arginine translocase subunit TatB [Sulfitobacter algicola]